MIGNIIGIVVLLIAAAVLLMWSFAVSTVEYGASTKEKVGNILSWLAWLGLAFGVYWTW